MKKYYSKSKKQELVEEQHNSGVSMREWCENHNIPVSTFYGWTSKRESKKRNKNFVKLDSNPKIVNNSKITIEIRDVRIVIDDNIELLQRILKGIS